jgi:hypothetical protein
MFDFAQTAKTAALLFNSDAVVEVDNPAAIRARIDASHAPAFREAMVGGARQTETMTTRARATPRLTPAGSRWRAFLWGTP